MEKAVSPEQRQRQQKILISSYNSSGQALIGLMIGLSILVALMHTREVPLMFKSRFYDPRRMSILAKLIISCLIASIPLYVVSLIVTSMGAASVKDNITRSTMSHLNFYMNALEREVDHLLEQKKQLFADDDLQYLSSLLPVMSDIEQTSSIQRVVRKLLTIKESSAFVEEIMIDIPMLDRVIYTNFLQQRFPEEHLKFLKAHIGIGKSPIFTDGQKLYLGSMHPANAENREVDPVFTIQVTLSIPKIQNILSQISSGTGSSLIFSNDASWHVTEGEGSELATRALDSLLNVEGIGTSSGQHSIRIGKEDHLIFYLNSRELQATIAYIIPESEIYGPLTVYRGWIWGVSILSVIIILCSSLLVIRAIHRPMLNLINAFRQVQKGNLNVRITHNWKDEFEVLSSQFNLMVERLNQLIQEVYEHTIREQQLELRQLQSQINPHFLYNSFYMVQRMAIAEDYRNVISLTQHLSEYFQFITRSSDEEIPLEKEVNHARVYTDIQLMRFGKQLTIQFAELPQSYRQLMVPRLILQPIVENAFKYGLEQKLHDWQLRISFAQLDGGLHIVVEDNGEKLTDELLQTLTNTLADRSTSAETTGLINVHRRIRLKFGEEAGITLARSELGGLKVIIRLIGQEASQHHPDIMEGMYVPIAGS